MLPRPPWCPPCHPAAWHCEGRPSLCFQSSPHSCHLQRSVGKSSPHEVIQMERHICRIFIFTCVRASSGCSQSLCPTYSQLEWGFCPRGQQAVEGRVDSTPKGGWPGRGIPAMPRASVSSPLALWGRGLAGPCVPGCSCIVTDVEQLPVLCCLSEASQKVETTEGIST